MDADEVLGIGVTKNRGDEPAPVAALRGKAAITQDVGHERGEAMRDLLDAEALLPGREGKPVARERGRDHGEGVSGIAAETRGIGEARDDVEELEHRAGPAMRQQQRARCGPLAGDVKEVEVDAGERDVVLRELIEPGLGCSPVEALAPIGEEAREPRDVGAIGPGCAGRCIRQAGSREPLAEVGDRRIGNRKHALFYARSSHDRLFRHPGPTGHPSAKAGVVAIAAAVPRMVLRLIFFILILPIPEVLRRQLTQKRKSLGHSLARA